MNTPPSLQHLKIAGSLVLGVLIAGTVGYMLIEQLSFLDAIYTTVDMMATVGSIVHPMSAPGRLFTIFVIIFGVGAVLYTFGSGMEFMIEGHFNQMVRRYLMDQKIIKLRGHSIICGFGRVGSQIAEDFSLVHRPFIIIDEKEENINECIRRGYLALQGDATHDDILHEAGVPQARCVLAATDNDAHNIAISLSVRHLNREIFIVARANRNETKATLKMAGADRVLSPYTIGGHRMANLAIQPTVIEFVDSMTSTGNELAVQEVTLAHTSQLIGKTIAEAQSTINTGLVIVALKKPGDVITGPGEETQIEANDTLIAVGALEQLARFKTKHGH
jgi:voltage-gated potassium channel